MNILFIHQNYPGQYREIMPRLAATGRHRIVFLTQRRGLPEPADHAIVTYGPDHQPAPDAYSYSAWFERNCGNGIGAAKACGRIKAQGFAPDIVIGHIGWGEMTFVKEIWPDVPVVGYFEYYFIPEGGCLGFDPEFPERANIAALLHARNATNYLAYMRCDAGHSATLWQKQTYPPLFHDKISVMHEGVRTDLLQPDHESAIEVPLADPPFRRGDELVTFIARNLEPIRGVHTFLRALPKLQAERPGARIAIIGGDEVSYGAKLAEGDSYRARLMRELGDTVDWSAVHFLGRIGYGDLVKLLKLSRCHVYLTAPFVISWSMLEAMALEKTVIASDVAPMHQFIDHGRNGLLVDFFSPDGLAETIADVLGHDDNRRALGRAARADVLANYDFASHCYPEFIRFLNAVLPQTKQIEL